MAQVSPSTRLCERDSYEGPTVSVRFPYSQEWNTPPSFTNTTNPANAAAYDDHFLLIQSVVIDGQDRVWALDTGRPTVNGTALPSSPYGPKLVGFNLNGTHLRTIAFPPNVAYSDSVSLLQPRFSGVHDG